MPLASLVDAVRDYLLVQVAPAPKLVGGAYPVAPGDLAAVTISIGQVAERLRSLGSVPVPLLTGALRIESTLDLANPVVTFPDETVNLLSADRKTVQLAHGPVVRADGTDGPPWAAADIRVALGATTFKPVAIAPGSGEVQVTPGTGQLVFQAALPAAGQLALGYFVGEWEVRTERYQGTLTVETFATDAAGVDTLSRAVDLALVHPVGAGVAGLRSLDPAGFGPVLPADPTRARARSRVLTYRFDYELVKPRLPTAGGLIARVAVDSTYGSEHFDVVREGS